MKSKHTILIAALIAGQLGASLRAEDTNNPSSGALPPGGKGETELIQQLQKRLEELEQKVKMLEGAKEAAERSAEAQAKQRAEELDQKLKAQQREQEAVQQAKDAEAKQRIGELDQQVKILERNRELDQEAAVEKSKSAPTVSLASNGLVIRSGDSNFLMNIHGYIQADARFYFNDRNLANDTFLLRRVRPIIEGTVFDKFDYRFMPDFGSGNVTSSSAGNNAILDDAYVNARFWPQVQIQAGKFKSPVGLERLQSTAELLFIETGYATQLTPNYDVGAEVHNSLFNAPVNYAIGIFNGAIDAGSSDADTVDEGKDVAGRIFLQPFLRTDIAALNKLGFGVGGSVGHHEGTLPTYKTPGQQTFFSYTNGVVASGQKYRIDPQLYYYWGPFGVLAEYILSSQEVRLPAGGPAHQRFNNRAWQVEASYFLTGDENLFRSTSRNLFHPRHPFNVSEHWWGAFELVGRVGQLTLDRAAFPKYVTTASAQEATSWGVGLNWYLNSNLRLYVDYESTRFTGGSKAANSVTADDEHVLLGRVQVSF